jgi:hypothetical protein
VIARSGIEARRIAPQSLQPVKRTPVLDEHVYHEVDEVHQNPLADPAPFDVRGATAVTLDESFFDGVSDGHDLSLARAVANDEVVGDVAQAAKVQDHDILGLLVLGRLDALGELRSQRVPSCP